MRKITLDLESLAVTSFQTASAVPAAGTVRAHEDEEVTTACPVYSDAIRNSAYASCVVICDCTNRNSAC